MACLRGLFIRRSAPLSKPRGLGYPPTLRGLGIAEPEAWRDVGLPGAGGVRLPDINGVRLGGGVRLPLGGGVRPPVLCGVARVPTSYPAAGLIT